MELQTILDLLVNEIHSVVMATTSANRPVTRVIDLMMHDGETLYFLTAKGKAFYQELMSQHYIALTGMCGGEGYDIKEASLHKKAISLSGEVENIGQTNLAKIFEKNPYMASIYPTQASREALEVFKIVRARGEYFDLSTQPITRFSFAIGDQKLHFQGYLINAHCVGCGECVKVCPSTCIETNTIPYTIDTKHCLHCGNCLKACQFGAVEKKI